MNTEKEIRKNFKENNNYYWERKLADGVTECYSKDYYNSDFTRIEDEIIKKIESELNSI
jgi:hypothetical protein